VIVIQVNGKEWNLGKTFEVFNIFAKMEHRLNTVSKNEWKKYAHLLYIPHADADPEIPADVWKLMRDEARDFMKHHHVGGEVRRMLEAIVRWNPSERIRCTSQGSRRRPRRVSLG